MNYEILHRNPLECTT